MSLRRNNSPTAWLRSTGFARTSTSTGAIRSGSSWPGARAGAFLAVAAVNAGASPIAGIVGRYGYYGDLAPDRPQPPLLVIHGENDVLVRPARVREFVDRMRAGSSQPVEYVELPGAHHTFDVWESIRANAVSIAVERFVTAAAEPSPRDPEPGA